MGGFYTYIAYLLGLKAMVFATEPVSSGAPIISGHLPRSFWQPTPRGQCCIRCFGGQTKATRALFRTRSKSVVG